MRLKEVSDPSVDPQPKLTSRCLLSLFDDGAGFDETAVTLSVVGATLEDMLAEQRGLERDQQSATDSHLSPKVLVTLPIFRFLQLLCENHNRDLQASPSHLSTCWSEQSHLTADFSGCRISCECSRTRTATTWCPRR